MLLLSLHHPLYTEVTLDVAVNKLLGCPIKELTTVINMLACEPSAQIPSMLDCLKVAGCSSSSSSSSSTVVPASSAVLGSQVYCGVI